MQNINRTFDYYYGNEGDQFSYVRVPKYLFDDFYFSSLSQEAIILYSLMQDRMSLSSKNDWRDENGRVYIRYSRDEIEKDLNLGHTKASAVIKELISVGLIERKVLGQGRVAIIFVKNFARYLGNIRESIADNNGLDDHRIFDYYYGNEGSQFRHFIIPKMLFDDEYFSGLRLEAKILYSRMLDRMYLSAQKEWIDNQGRVFIYYSNEEMEKDLNRGHNIIVSIVKDLVSVGLIERKKRGQGKPSIIYVKNFVRCISSTDKKSPDSSDAHSVKNDENSLDWQNLPIKTSQKRTSRLPENGRLNIPKTDVKTSRKRTSGFPRNGHQDFPETDTNNTKINEPYKNNSSINQSSEIDSMDRENENSILVIRKNIDYDAMMSDIHFTDKERFDGLFDLICDIVRSSHKTVRIGGEDIPLPRVRERFFKLKAKHLVGVINRASYDVDDGIIKNPRAYYLTSLYNAPITFSLNDQLSAEEILVDTERFNKKSEEEKEREYQERKAYLKEKYGNSENK